MGEALRFHDFGVDKNEHQLEPDDRVVATYLVTNTCDCVELTDVAITHVDRVANDGTVVLRCEPATVVLAGSLAPNEERQVTVELITKNHVPGRHPLRVQARFNCRPVAPEANSMFEFTVAAD